MTQGPLFNKIILFSLPLMVSNILQLLFHATDLIVVGRYASAEALAAVGTTGAFSVLMLNIFFGMATGINVLAARYIGARDPKRLSYTIHTAMAVACFGGLAMAIFSIIITKPVLQLMGTPENILDKAALYMWICNAGMPFVVIYNFGSAIMRAAGDTRRPLIYMVIAGVVNVLLNLFFVLIFKWDVAGVAVATVTANAISSFLIIRAMRKNKDNIHLDFKKIKIHFATIKNILKIGIPAAIQGSFYSLSNMTIQSSVNSLGWQAMAGNTASSSIEGIVYVGGVAFYHASISFTSQNYGAKQYKRIIKSILYCAGSAAVCSTVLGSLCLIFSKPMLEIYNNNPEVIKWGMIRLSILMSTYFMCSVMDVCSGALRGLGHSFKPMLVTLIFVCILRIFWVFFIFPLDRSLTNLMISYPVSWFLTTLVNGTILFLICRNMMRHTPTRLRKST